MRVLVVFESMYGNTRTVASNITDGLRATHEVTLVPVGEATAGLLAAADLLIVGGPTHMHGMSSATTRRMAAQAAAREDSELTLDPGARGPGIRDWLQDIAASNTPAAVFDTRFAEVPAFTGRASRRIARQLRRHGYRLIAAPESFLVSQENTLLCREADRARQWGMTVAAASKTYVHT
jgi:Flavodoxin